jgi:UrcA family protein
MLSSLELAFKIGVRTATLIALCVAAPFAAYAQSASDAAQARSAKVSLGDLDLATAEGARTAHHRLHAAAQLACSRVEDRLDLGRQQHFAECVDAAMVLALPQVEELIRKRSLAYSVARD